MAENMAEFRKEGQEAFPVETDKEKSASSPEDTTKAEQNPSLEGGKNTPDEDKIPFHEHPRWKQREEEWKSRFNEQDTRHQDDLKKIREEFGSQKKANIENTDIPSWFGGNKEMWDAYRADEDARLAQAEERAIKRISEAKSKEEQAVKEATDYMQAQMAAIESDSVLNPTGVKIDPNKLIRFVIDNDCVDSQGRWNYKLGFRLMQGAEPKSSDDRRKIAEATKSGNKGEAAKAEFKTPDDFRKKKPW